MLPHKMIKHMKVCSFWCLEETNKESKIRFSSELNLGDIFAFIWLAIDELLLKMNFNYATL